MPPLPPRPRIAARTPAAADGAGRPLAAVYRARDWASKASGLSGGFSPWKMWNRTDPKYLWETRAEEPTSDSLDDSRKVLAAGVACSSLASRTSPPLTMEEGYPASNGT